MPQSTPLSQERELSAGRIWVLKRVHLLPSSSAEFHRYLSEHGHGLSLVPRQMLFVPADGGDAIHVLERGRLKVTVFDGAGREITLAILERGEFFGEETREENQLRRGSAVALERSKLWRIDRSEFERGLAEHPALAREVTQELVRRWWGSESNLTAILAEDEPQRLAKVLLSLAEIHGQPEAGGATRLAVRLTLQELGLLLQIPRDRLMELLTELERQGLLRLAERSMALTDLARFRARIGEL